ncbi:MAG: 30S ribosomal protein S6 [Gammaproteobacteria bacterium]|nr:30S ribosomal protein S6 [Gammaproteobacteria bacterium]
MRCYELLVITKQSYIQDNSEPLIQELSEAIKDYGEVIKHEYWGVRNFCHMIRRKRRGHYILVYLKIDSSVLSELETKLSLNDSILRWLIIQIKEIPEYDSPILSNTDPEKNKKAGNLLI